MQRKVYEKRKKSFRKMLHISAKCFTFLGPCLLLFNSMRTVISVKLLRLAQKTLAFQYLHLPLSLPWLSYLLLHLIQWVDGVAKLEFYYSYICRSGNTSAKFRTCSYRRRGMWVFISSFRVHYWHTVPAVGLYFNDMTLNVFELFWWYFLQFFSFELWKSIRVDFFMKGNTMMDEVYGTMMKDWDEMLAHWGRHIEEAMQEERTCGRNTDA